MNKYKSKIRLGRVFFNELHRVMKNEGHFIIIYDFPIYVTNNW